MNELSDKSKHDKEAIIKRLRRIEGQVKGIQKMVNEEKYCVDILIQIAAIRSAIDKVGGIILENHVKRCVKKTIDNSNGEETDRVIDELIKTMLKFMK
ncbi:metal-sensitive transcriptional regulator [Tepidibacter formicigenes]|uniref:DNA-binding transcriptional regulator, FrmR family n=1 Tax=Tepidibacter formicigenes DSM 15518 TaxID=1123349 RepID=A0A1M6MV57_9FIRM|nr:metal-sensitive transcriptional regulator [Tepidibacter formicigenes]SHJ87306.1 DNA-binding transcriptional regulator, FrmR family [Tepidibacter formicigenes DSM 15518]